MANKLVKKNPKWTIYEVISVAITMSLEEEETLKTVEDHLRNLRGQQSHLI